MNHKPRYKNLNYKATRRKHEKSLWLKGVLCACSVISDSVTPWTVARQAPLSMGFCRQEHWLLLLLSRFSHVPTLCNPTDGSPAGSSISGILQAKILEWVAISFSRRSSLPRNWTCVQCRQIPYHWATWEALMWYLFCLPLVKEKNKITFY